jgi:polysaccharide deacetylase family protein (PEP-CTERM system associated)
VKNALTIDVEDYFQVAALASAFPRERWDHAESRIEQSMARLLSLCRKHRARGTFFTLGVVAKKFPAMVREIVADGHELASHGYDHTPVWAQSPGAFFADVLKSRHLLEEIGGVAVRGYRAPNFSIDRRTPWAHGLIAQAGYHYSSSVYPVRHDHYGMPDAPRAPRVLEEGVREIPITTCRYFNRNIPAGGGGFFRLLPYAVSAWMIRRVNHLERQPAVFYLHPWELDPAQPRAKRIGLKSRFRHYLNLGRTEDRLASLLTDFEWGRMDEVFARVLHEA